MGKLIKLRVFLYGLKGTGIEVAKNVALAGPAVLCLHDPSPASKEDMATNFYLAEQSNSTGSRTDMAVKDKI
jgi:ubiquitin-activating enzyme E1